MKFYTKNWKYKIKYRHKNKFYTQQSTEVCTCKKMLCIVFYTKWTYLTEMFCTTSTLYSTENNSYI